jgi:hypothetical protein
MELQMRLFPLLFAGALLAAEKVPTGPNPGSTIPAFSAVDQTGRTRQLGDLTGPKGLMLVFFRSADW